jgi:hypothetical protein
MTLRVAVGGGMGSRAPSSPGRPPLGRALYLVLLLLPSLCLPAVALGSRQLGFLGAHRAVGCFG